MPCSTFINDSFITSTYCDGRPVLDFTVALGQEIIIGPIMALGWAHQHAFNRRGLFTFKKEIVFRSIIICFTAVFNVVTQRSSPLVGGSVA